MAKQSSAYFSDHWTVQDALNFDDSRNALLNILKTAATPLTVGIFGPWGSGKTSLLRQLEDELIQAGGGYKFRPVWFTAWKYDHQEALWRALILRVIESLYPKDAKTGERLKRDDLKDDGQIEGVEYLDRLANSLYQDVNWREGGEWSIQWDKLAGEGARLPAWMIFHIAGMGDAAKQLGINPDLAKGIAQEFREMHMHQLESMEQFEREFSKAVELLLDKDGRLIVFVDDLDRCLPEKAIEVLEAIKLFLNVPRTVFVLGMDREIIRRGIESHYGIFYRKQGEERAELPVNGDVYLQKLIQLPFNLPPLDIAGREEFIRALQEGIPTNAHLNEMTMEVFARGLFPNPRQVKRALNIFNLLKDIARNRIENKRLDAELIAWPLLAKTVLIQSQWPELYALWRQMPTIVQTLEDEYTRNPITESELIRGRGKRQTGEEDEGKVPEGGTAPATPTMDGGVLAEFTNQRQKYQLLAQLLTFPESDQVGTGQMRARFAGLSREAMQVYLGLAGAAEAEPPVAEVSISGDLITELSSGDQARVRDAISRFMTEQQEGEDRETVVQEQLLQIMGSDALEARARVEAGNALAEVGDPRFREDAWYLPADDLLGFVQIPAGPAILGEEDKQHEISLPMFYLAKYPTTVAQFSAYVEVSGNQPEREDALKGIANHPVVYVSWDEALAYTHWLKNQLLNWESTPPELYNLLNQGWQITLPSEAQWEKTARGGDGLIYPWGNEFDVNKANTEEPGISSTSPVGAFPGGATPRGVHDLSGNVWEWTRSIYDAEKFPYPYDPADGRENLGDEKSFRVLRGGSWYSAQDNARASRRNRDTPNFRNFNLGFRVCLSDIQLR